MHGQVEKCPCHQWQRWLHPDISWFLKLSLCIPAPREPTRTLTITNDAAIHRVLFKRRQWHGDRCSWHTGTIEPRIFLSPSTRTCNHCPIPNSRSSNAGTIRPSAVGPTFNRRFLNFREKFARVRAHTHACICTRTDTHAHAQSLAFVSPRMHVRCEVHDK